MQLIEKNHSLKAFNSFRFDQRAEHFARVSTDEELVEVIQYARTMQWPLRVIGEGSNLVLTQDVLGLVVHLACKEIVLHSEHATGHQRVTATAGVNWHQLVLYTLNQGIQGLENLSLIPGSVGAAPVQNIGAYGVEVGERIDTVRALHVPSLSWHTLTREACRFSYRDSVFKHPAGEYIITAVTFSLGSQHPVTFHYQSLKELLAETVSGQPTATQVSNAVIATRQSKLPDPSIVANAGSFFHNPIVPTPQAEALRLQFPQLVSFPADKGFIKLSAGWMIEHCGYKGVIHQGVGVYEKQALVLINTGSGNGKALLSLANDIQASVQNRFGVKLTIEPTVI